MRDLTVFRFRFWKKREREYFKAVSVSVRYMRFKKNYTWAQSACMQLHYGKKNEFVLYNDHRCTVVYERLKDNR